MFLDNHWSYVFWAKQIALVKQGRYKKENFEIIKAVDMEGSIIIYGSKKLG